MVSLVVLVWTMLLAVRSRRDFAGLEERRRTAGRLFAKGKTQAEVSRELGVSRQSTSQMCIRDSDQLGPDAFDGGEETCQVDIGRHGPLVDDEHVPVAQREGAVIEAPAERGDCPRVDAGTIGEVLRRLTRRGGPDHAAVSYTHLGTGQVIPK